VYNFTVREPPQKRYSCYEGLEARVSVDSLPCSKSAAKAPDVAAGLIARSAPSRI